MDKEKEYCEWKIESDFETYITTLWGTRCNRHLELTKGIRYKFCPYCGKEIKATKLSQIYKHGSLKNDTR